MNLLTDEQWLTQMYKFATYEYDARDRTIPAFETMMDTWRKQALTTGTSVDVQRLRLFLFAHEFSFVDQKVVHNYCLQEVLL